MWTMSRRGAAIILALLAAGAPAGAAEYSTEELARETQNPVANLISVPFQNNFNFGVGADRKMVWNLNVQPVIPFPLSENWNLITRTIVPIINRPSTFPGQDDAFGMGDISATDGNHWTLPVGGGVGRLWRIGEIGLPLNTQLVPFYNAVVPDNGPDWQLRFQFQFLFPR